jgi:hypothetical protein
VQELHKRTATAAFTGLSLIVEMQAFQSIKQAILWLAWGAIGQVARGLHW